MVPGGRRLRIAACAMALASLAAAHAQIVGGECVGSSLFIWDAVAANASVLDKVALTSQMLSFCGEFDQLNANARHPGQGLHCRLVFLGSSILPSVAVQLEDCCQGAVAHEIQVAYPGIEACKNLPFGQDFGPVNISLITAALETQPTGAPTPVPTAAAGLLGTTTYSEGTAATLLMGLADWRFWLLLLLLLLLMLLFLICLLCCLCGKYRRKEKDDAFIASQRSKTEAQSQTRAAFPAALARDEEDPIEPIPRGLPPTPSDDRQTQTADVLVVLDLPALPPKPPAPKLEPMDDSDSDDGQDLRSFYIAKREIPDASEARPTPFSSLAGAVPAREAPDAWEAGPTPYRSLAVAEPAGAASLPDVDAQSVSTAQGSASPFDDVTMPISRMHREGMGDDSSSDASSIRTTHSRIGLPNRRRYLYLP